MRKYAPVQVSHYEHGYTRPLARFVSRSMEHHGSAELALRIAGMVQMRVYYRNVAGVPVLVLVVLPRGGYSGSSNG
jgi:hypothetical protein